MSAEQVNRIYKVTDTQILGFFKEHRFLSNFHSCKIWYDGLTYESTEAAYQALKCATPEMREVFTTMSPVEAKKYGQRITLREDWEEVKWKIMVQLTLIKYLGHPELAESLLATGERELVEENWWGDVYWGRCNGVGQNKLGNTLMHTRELLRFNGL